jgi:L-threonylcarbamoyladenylate synthase
MNQLLDQLRNKKIILLPTDTLPGLSFLPKDQSVSQALEAIKGRPENKGFVTLAGSLEQAMRFWQALPEGWVDILEKIWPGPVTVIWRGGASISPYIMKDGLLAIRVPKLSPQHGMVSQLLSMLSEPLPSTSVNKSGETPCTLWSDACQWAQTHGVFVDTALAALDFSSPKSQGSTVIRINPTGTFTLLRQGDWQITGVKHLMEPS